MYEEYDMIDGEFTLNWNEDSKDFKFYYQKSIISPGHNFMLTMIAVLFSFLVSTTIVTFVLKNTDDFSASSYEIFNDVVLRFIFLMLCALFAISLIWFLIEIVFVSPRFKLNKSSVVYITDGRGLYVVDYSVGGHDCSAHSSFPVIIDKIINESNIKFKFKKEYFKSVTYLDSYNVISSSKEYIILDVPEDNPIYDDLNDFEISNSVVGFSELRSYLENQDGGLYLE